MGSPGNAPAKFSIDEACEVLERTPAAVRSLLGGLSDAWTSGGTPDYWAPFDILGHLIHGEWTDWIPRARIILEQGDDRRFVPFEMLAQFEASKGKSTAELLDEFEKARAENIEILRSWNLSDEQLQLTGIHPEFGEATLEQLLATWMVHDLNHIRQIATFMAKRYDREVGPWKQYLSILR
jgi:hypothetical protein